MPSHYCLYYTLSKAKWTLPCHWRPVVEPWTLSHLTEMFNGTYKRNKILEVEFLPKLNAIELNRLVLPETHLELGTNNSISCGFENRIEICILVVPADDQLKPLRLDKLTLQIKEEQQTM